MPDHSRLITARNAGLYTAAPWQDVNRALRRAVFDLLFRQRSRHRCEFASNSFC